MALIYNSLGLVSLLVLSMLPAQAQGTQAQAREWFFLAGNEPCMAERLLDITDGDQSGRQVILAYRGAAYAMLADCVRSPIHKLKNFKRGKEIIDGAIREDPDDPEIRFIRFMVQDRAPAFLAYDNRKEDLSLLLSAFMEAQGSGATDSFLVKMAISVSSSDFPDEEQKNIMRSLDKK